jgi:hypothetical protein
VYSTTAAKKEAKQKWARSTPLWLRQHSIKGKETEECASTYTFHGHNPVEIHKLETQKGNTIFIYIYHVYCISYLGGRQTAE